MRAYFFGNMYISQIQQGIQALHVVGDMAAKYQPHQPHAQEKKDMFFEWADKHKTVVLLNAGFSAEILSLFDFFDVEKNPYPWAAFNEDPLALGEGHTDGVRPGALTSIGIVLPEKIYEAAKMIRTWRPAKGETWDISPQNQIDYQGYLTFGPDNAYGYETNERILWEFSKWEYDLTIRLNNYRLA